MVLCGNKVKFSHDSQTKRPLQGKDTLSEYIDSCAIYPYPFSIFLSILIPIFRKYKNIFPYIRKYKEA